MVETDSLSFILSCCSIPFYIIGLIGNVLVIRIVHKTREMHTPTNYLLASMAVSDVFTIMMFAAHGFAFSQYVNDENFVQYLVCKASALITTFAIVSSITLTVLAVERYNALLKPLRTGLQLSEDNIKKAIALIWVTSVFVSIPNAFFQEFDRSNRVLSGCVGQGDSNINLAWKILIVFDALFLIQSVVMVFCYGSLIRGLYFTNTICQETETTDGERSSEKKKLVITFLLATVGFLIGYVPSMAFYTVVAFQTNANIGMSLFSDLENSFQFLFGCSLCLNPLVYAFRSAHFREGFRRVLTSC